MPETTGWMDAATAPRDSSIIEVRYDDRGRGPWSVSCRRSPDGVFRDLEGNPLYLTPDEWREMSMAEHQTTLLACPFCLGTNVIIDQFSDVIYVASCEDMGCMAIGPEAATREEAAVKWNACRRPEPAL